MKSPVLLQAIFAARSQSFPELPKAWLPRPAQPSPHGAPQSRGNRGGSEPVPAGRGTGSRRARAQPAQRLGTAAGRGSTARGASSDTGPGRRRYARSSPGAAAPLPQPGRAGPAPRPQPPAPRPSRPVLIAPGPAAAPEPPGRCPRPAHLRRLRRDPPPVPARPRPRCSGGTGNRPAGRAPPAVTSMRLALARARRRGNLKGATVGAARARAGEQRGRSLRL